MNQIIASALPEKGMGRFLWWGYRILLVLLFPLGWLWIQGRLLWGKEDRARLSERFGVSSIEKRPPGTLIWLHGASVGEVMGVLGLVEALLAHRTEPSFLLTTGTVASARIMQKRFAKEPRVIHQMVPFDWPWCVERFLHFWRPTVGLLAEGDFWPHLMTLPPQKGIPLFLINAQLSERSVRRWSWVRSLFRVCTQNIRGCLTVSHAQSKNFRSLEAPHVHSLGSLKWSAPLLPVESKILKAYQKVFKERFVLLAASTHRGEEKLILGAYRLLRQNFSDLLLVLAPRYPARRASIEKLCHNQNFSVTRKGTFNPDESSLWDVFLVDEMGSLGLFYRLASLVFVGGSLKPGIGGHNPVEPAALGKPIVCGPFVKKQAAIMALLQKEKACRCLETSQDLEATLKELLGDSKECKRLGKAAQALVEEQCEEVLKSYLKVIVPFLMPKEIP